MKIQSCFRLSTLTAIWLSLLFLCPVSASAEEDNTFGGWEFTEVYHNFGKSGFFGSVYFEHDNYQYKRMECWYIRTTAGYKINSWLKGDVCYDYMREPGQNVHRALFDLTETLKQGNLSVALRERYVSSWTPGLDERSDVLRTRLKVQYAIPQTRFKPYLAMEIFTWDKWKKTRHYVATTYTINEHMEAEAYYLYYTFAGKPAEHVIGVGLNFEF